MILIIVVYSSNVEALQAAVDHSNEDHQCEQMENCQFIGDTLINKVDWVLETLETRMERLETKLETRLEMLETRLGRLESISENLTSNFYISELNAGISDLSLESPSSTFVPEEFTMATEEDQQEDTVDINEMRGLKRQLTNTTRSLEAELVSATPHNSNVNTGDTTTPAQRNCPEKSAQPARKLRKSY